MAYVHTLICDRCGYQWRWLQMNKEEAVPPCANPRCSNQKVTQGLVAPGVARGAAETTSWAVPQTRAGREKFAYEMAEGMGFTNMKDNLRPGEIAAPPAPEPVVTAPNGRQMKVPHGFQNVGSTPEAISGAIATMTGGGGGAQVNRAALNVLGGLKRH